MSQPPQPEKKIQLSSVGRLLFPSEIFKEVDSKSLKEDLVQLGMIKENEETYVRKFPVKDYTIFLSNGKTIEPTSEGDLFLTEADFKSLANSFQLKIKGNLIPSKDYQYSPAERKIIFESTIQDFLAKRMDCHADKKGDNPTLSGYKEMGRCMDYNGQFTDGRNYPKSNPRAYSNFIGSDCDIAISKGNCLLDHYYGGCAVNHGGRTCSSILGCSEGFHMHSKKRIRELMGLSSL